MSLWLNTERNDQQSEIAQSTRSGPVILAVIHGIRLGYWVSKVERV